MRRTSSELVLNQILEHLPSGGTRTYASVASTLVAPKSKPCIKCETRPNELTLKIHHNAQEGTAAPTPPSMVCERIEKAMKSTGIAELVDIEVKGIREGSGTLTIRLNKAAVKAASSSADRWSSGAGRGAKLSIPHFALVLEGVLTSFNPFTEGACAELFSRNSHLMPSAECIVEMRWVNHRLDPKTCWFKSAALLVVLNDRQAADNILDQAVLLKSMMLFSHIYEPAPMQCLRCSKFGHMQQHCHAKLPACGRCSGEHTTRECVCPHDTKCGSAYACNISFKCCNCRGNHPAFDRACPVKLQERERIRFAHADRIYFAEDFEFNSYTHSS